jgi:aminoglycoside 2'-N-acetyltransferase I
MSSTPAGPVRRATTGDLSTAEINRIRVIMDAAFAGDPDERFTDDDWVHATGGVHFILVHDDLIVTHAAVVERPLEIAGRPVQAGYVEAVATAPAYDRQGFGSVVMTDVNAFITATYELGALGTGRFSFYGRLGWERWLGPSAVRLPDGEQATPEDDGYLMVLRTPASPPFALTDRISCDQRIGDVW